MDKKKFGSYIKESRLKKGYTQKELADLLFIDVTAISKWERGVTFPDITLIPDICKYLEVNEHELIESSNDTEYRKLKRDAKKFNSIKNTIFWLSTISYLSAILTCFIVNLAVNHTLSWFFIVFVGCLCGFTFCPTVLRFFEKKKLLIFCTSTILSLFILFLTISIYTKNYWCFTAMAGTFLGYLMIFLPFFLSNQKKYLSKETYFNLSRFFTLIYGAFLCVFTVVLLLVVNAYTEIKIAMSIEITLFGFVLFAAFGIVSLFRLKPLISVGISFIITAIYSIPLCFFLCDKLGGNVKDYTQINFSDFANHTNANVSFLIFVSLVASGIVLIILGIFAKRKET